MKTNHLPLLLICLVTLMMFGCVHEPPSPTAVDDADFIEAKPQEEPKPAPIVRQVAKPVPLPGQLKPMPPADEKDPCPICTKKGVPRAKSIKPHTHRSHEIIEHANAKARLKPELQGYFNSVQIYDYTEGALYQVYTAPIHETAIIFQPGEVLQSASAGDTKRWIIGNVSNGTPSGEQELILIKPTHSNLKTNMVITTNKRRYLLELRSYKETYMAGVSWHYPQESFVKEFKKRKARDDADAVITDPDVSINNLYFGYSINAKNHVRWKPVRVFDDGKKTYIQFPETLATTEAPALFILSRRKKVQLVNYRVRGTYYIVDRLFDMAELRLGKKPMIQIRIVRNEKHT